MERTDKYSLQNFIFWFPHLKYSGTVQVWNKMKVSRWCLNVPFGLNSPFKSLKLTQTLIKERLYPLSESDFLAVCPTGADVREDLKGALHGADISAEAWGSSLLWAFQSQLDNQTTCRVTSSPLPSPLFLSALHRHEEALVRLLALHLPGQADKYRAKVPNSTGKETLPVSFGRDWIHHFSKITHCAEKGKRLKNKHLVREREE